MKFHRHVKRTESSLKLNQNFCEINGDFGSNISDLMRALVHFLATEEIQGTGVKANLEFKIWKIPNGAKHGKLVSAKYLPPLHRNGDSPGATYDFITKIGFQIDAYN